MKTGRDCPQAGLAEVKWRVCDKGAAASGRLQGVWGRREREQERVRCSGSLGGLSQLGGHLGPLG